MANACFIKHPLNQQTANKRIYPRTEKYCPCKDKYRAKKTIVTRKRGYISSLLSLPRIRNTAMPNERSVVNRVKHSRVYKDLEIADFWGQIGGKIFKVVKTL